MSSEAVNALYEAFAKVEKPKEIFGCRADGDLTPDEGSSLLRVALRKTPPKLVEKLANSCTFVGGAKSLEYFLPRIFELLLKDKIEIRIPSLFFDVLKELTLNSIQKEVLGHIFARLVEKICKEEIDDFILDWMRGAASLNLSLKPAFDVLDRPSLLSAKQYFFEIELGYNIPSGVLSREADFLDWFNANIDLILDP